MQKPSWKHLMLTSGLTVLSACGAPSADATESQGQAEGAASTASTPAGKFLRSSDAIPGQYIVVLKGTSLRAAQVSQAAQKLALPQRATVTRAYAHALNGFVAQTTEEGARAIAAQPEVEYVVEDGHVHTTATQSGATWGLDRIDQLNLPLNGTYSYGPTGAGVNVYIIDTGIETSHPQFGGRASGDYTAVADGNGTNDCNGHGTHVAGTVGGATWGVAKAARLHGVRVLGCNGSGTISGVIAGVDWVTANRIKPAVANMSLGGSPNPALDAAVSNSIASGVTYVIAAGNSYIDACYPSPARVPEALTVGASDSTDSTASFSNWGPCLDVYAPGVAITSAYLGGGSATLDGTSMAAPHVAGVAALYLESNRAATPATVAAAIVLNAPANKVRNTINGSTTRLLYSNPPPACGTLGSGQALAPGQTLSACSGKAVLAHQTDGNVVLYAQSGAVLWNTGTWNQTTSTFVMQTDGNLVLYPSSVSAIWNTGTYGNNGAYLKLQDDCNLAVYSAGGSLLWASQTTCR